MIVKYTNDDDIEITSSQISGLETYNKIQIDSGKVKIKETYENKELVELTYFLQEDDDEEELITEHSSKPKYWLILSRRSTYGRYVIEDSCVYKDNEVLEKYRRLFIGSEVYFQLAKSDYHYLCHQKIDAASGSPILGRTNKQHYYIDQEEDGFIPYFEASYEEDGSISIITHYDVYDLDDHKGGRTIYGVEDASKFRFLIPENPDYYLDATFEPF